MNLNQQLTCPTPDFTWIPARGSWSACSRCHRFAWHHEQADPTTDIRNFIKVWTEHLPLGTFPPAMKTT